MKTSLRLNLILSCLCVSLISACAKISFNPVPEKEIPGATPEPAPTTSKTVSTTEIVAYGNKQVDFLLVLDDSASMLPELKKLAERMSSFVSSLEASKIDWQMCITTTRGSNNGNNAVHGRPLDWSSYTPEPGTPSYLLKKGTPNLNSIFNSTIDNLKIGGDNSSDERAIKAAHDNFHDSRNHECYRPGSAVSIIAISDEDERSVGGDPKKVKANESSSVHKSLEPEDYPQTLIEKTKAVFGPDVRFTFSSIIVKPDDIACEQEQDKDASPSHVGDVYAEISRLTNGGVGSICDADYSGNLNTFRDKIVNSLSSLVLQCEADPASLKVTTDNFPISGVRLEGKLLKFSYALVEGTQIDLVYDCLEKKE